MSLMSSAIAESARRFDPSPRETLPIAFPPSLEMPPGPRMAKIAGAPCLESFAGNATPRWQMRHQPPKEFRSVLRSQRACVGSELFEHLDGEAVNRLGSSTSAVNVKTVGGTLAQERLRYLAAA